MISKDGVNSKEATKLIDTKSDSVPRADRAKFIEATETEILTLHDGNFARYKVIPKELAYGNQYGSFIILTK